MKVEGLVYFVGITLGIYMIQCFTKFTIFFTFLGSLFITAGCFGYIMKIYFWNQGRKKNDKSSETRWNFRLLH